MRAEQPEIAGPADRVLRRLGDVVLVVAGAGGVLAAEQPVELVVVEAGQAQVEAVELQVVELEAEQPLVPLGVLARAVVHQPVGLGLRRGEAAGDVHRHLGQPELARRLEPRVPGEDHHLLVDDDRLAPAELLQRGRDGRDRALVPPRVARVGDELLERKGDDVHSGSWQCFATTSWLY